MESKHVVNKEAEDKTVVSCFSLTTLPLQTEHLKTVNGCCFISSPTQDVQRPLNPQKVREKRQTGEEASRKE